MCSSDLYDGTLFVVSHDRYLINKLADKVYELSPKGAELYNGNYDYYIEKRQAQLERQEQQAPPRVNLYKLRKERESELRRMRTALRRLEEEIEAADARRGELEERLNSPEVSADYEELTRVTGELTELNSRSEELLMEWTELSVELERQEAESES